LPGRAPEEKSVMQCVVTLLFSPFKDELAARELRKAHSVSCPADAHLWCEMEKFEDMPGWSVFALE
jgi:hypothetical protein